MNLVTDLNVFVINYLQINTENVTLYKKKKIVWMLNCLFSGETYEHVMNIVY